MIFVANIWPAMDSKEKREHIPDIIESYGRIIRTIETLMTRQGLRNYQLQIYSHQKWVGNLRNHFRQVEGCVKNRYLEGSTLQTYVFECSDIEKALNLKNEIRDYCGMEKDSIHISDDEKESESMLNLLENPNNLELMNHCLPDKYRVFTRNLDRLKKMGKSSGMNPDDFLIVSDAILSLYNIQKYNKISWVETGKESKQLDKLNQKEYEKQILKWKDEIENPDNHVVFLGFRFITKDMLDKIKTM